MSDYDLVLLAETGGPFAGFGPYVASIDDHGRVAFTAALRSGGTGVFFATEDGALEEVARSGGPVRDFVSHPDLAEDGSWCVYAELTDGRRVVASSGPQGKRFDGVGVGPLGPTMNDAGEIAVRARGGIAVLRRGELREVVAADAYREIHGLPVIDARGRVVFRAELHDGRQVIRRADGDAIETLAETGERFAELGRFPASSDSGLVVFAATLRDGSSGVFRHGPRGLEAVVGPDKHLAVRGALVDARERVLFLATEPGRALGVYSESTRVCGIGERLFGSTVVELALNPVSINAKGQFALRARRTDGRDFIEAIVRADPVP